MHRLTSHHHASIPQWLEHEWRDRAHLSRRAHSEVPSKTLMIAGLVAVGLGVVAWSYLGADLRRYMKIQSM